MDQPPKQRIVESGRRAITVESAALATLAAGLGADFAAAVRAMLSCTGRIIVTGMGKSGHIARKIAATFASTGAPAQFVHPAEASHGDLGMITTDDIVLVLSNSGETPELADIIAYCRRFSIPMIGVAANADSNLLQQSDIALVLPPAPEACAAGLVPTTSTTMTLALGDALAVAMMDARAFGPADFHAFHPRGQLGARLVRVTDIMHRAEKLPLVQTGTPMSEALLIMTKQGFGIAGVVDTQARLAGVITDGDLRRNMEGLLQRKAADVMTENPVTIPSRALATEALGLMNSHKITSVFVTDTAQDRTPVGILHLHDCLRAGVA